MRNILWVVMVLLCGTVMAETQAGSALVETEEVRKIRLQAEFAVQQKRFDSAVELYGQALKLAPEWSAGHFHLALALGETAQYRKAMAEMKLFLAQAPAVAEARTAQDKIYQWESVAEPEAGKTFKDCPTCPEMVEIPAGSFDMGATNGKPDELPVHRVTIARTFAIGKTEVTQEQWRALMKNEPSHFAGCGDTCPVEQVSWDDAMVYIAKLNALSGKQYRLPSEAEWEYACRAGKQEDYCGGDNADKLAWTTFNSGSFFFNTPHPVATKQANGFGLYDMSGNVWEWVADSYHENYANAPTDDSVWEGGKKRVLRGGAWGYDPIAARAASRFMFATTYRHYSHGFRVALTLLQ